WRMLSRGVPAHLGLQEARAGGRVRVSIRRRQHIKAAAARRLALLRPRRGDRRCASRRAVAQRDEAHQDANLHSIRRRRRQRASYTEPAAAIGLWLARLEAAAPRRRIAPLAVTQWCQACAGSAVSHYFFGFSFFLRCARVRRRNAFSRMNPSASRWS